MEQHIFLRSELADIADTPLNNDEYKSNNASVMSDCSS